MMKIGDRVRHKYPAHEVGTVVRVYNVEHEYKILVKFDKSSPASEHGLFMENALEILTRELVSD